MSEEQNMRVPFQAASPPTAAEFEQAVVNARYSASNSLSPDLFSEEEPYLDSGSSNYVPSGNSDSTSSTSPPPSPLVKFPRHRKNKVVKNLFPTSSGSVAPKETDSPTTDITASTAACQSSYYVPPAETVSTSSPVESSSAAEVNQSRKKLVQPIATLLLNAQKITLSLPALLHRGTYRIIFRDQPQNELSPKVGFLLHEARPATTHACVFHKPGEVPCFVRIVEGDTAEITAVRCLSNGELEGIVNDVSDFQIAPLMYTTGELPTATGSEKMKRHYCQFCGKLRTAMSRHLLTQHAEEPAVIAISKLPPKSMERLRMLDKLRIQGDNAYNVNVPRWKRIPLKQPSKTTIEEMITCVHCGGLISKKYFSQHEAGCSGRSKNMARVASVAKDYELDAKKSELSSEDFLVEKLLSHLHSDETGKIIREDKCIMLLAKMYAVKNRGAPHRNKNARQHLRIAARLLQRVKTYDKSIKDYFDALKNDKYKLLIRAMDAELSYNDTTEMYEKPSLGNIVRLVLINLLKVAQTDLAMSGTSSKHPLYRDLKEVLKLHRDHFSTAIGKTAYLATKRNQIAKEVKLPSLEDIVKFTKFINRAAENSYNELVKNGFQYKHWYTLNCALLLQIVVFNRRRPGEASRIRLESFHKRDSVTAKDYKHMNRLEILLSKQFVRMLTLGKRYRKLAILLKSQQVEHIKILISMRSQAGVEENNPYLFANNSSDGHFHVGVIIKKWAEKAELLEPELLRCTLLRKQVATMAQYMSLTDSDLRLVADGMGHDLAVHLQNYRQPEVNNQITKLSRFFMAVGDGEVSRFKGKSLAELQSLEQEFGDDDSSGDENDSQTKTLKSASLLDGGDDDRCSDVQQIQIDYPRTPPHSATSALQRRNSTLTPHGAQMTPRSRALHYSNSTVVVLSPLKIRKKERLHYVDITSSASYEAYKAKTTGNVSLRKRREKWTNEQQNLMMQYFGGRLKKKSYAKLSQVEEFVAKFKGVFKDRTARHVYSWLQYRINR